MSMWVINAGEARRDENVRCFIKHTLANNFEPHGKARSSIAKWQL